jgi:hypothetical protein
MKDMLHLVVADFKNMKITFFLIILRIFDTWNLFFNMFFEYLVIRESFLNKQMTFYVLSLI